MRHLWNHQWVLLSSREHAGPSLSGRMRDYSLLWSESS